MPSLSQATDAMLFRQGLISLPANDRASALLKPMECGLAPEHDWSKTRDDVPGEGPYQVCNDCGAVRRSPWRKD